MTLIRPLLAENATRLWRVMRKAGAQGLVAKDAAALADSSVAYSRKTLRIWAAAGLANYAPPASQRRSEAGIYSLSPDAPEHPPVVTVRGEVHPREGYMAGEAFAKLQVRSGLTETALGRLLGGVTPLAVKSMAEGGRVIDERIARKMSLLGQLLDVK